MKDFQSSVLYLADIWLWAFLNASRTDCPLAKKE